MEEWKFPQLTYSRPDFDKIRGSFIVFAEAVGKATGAQDVLDVIYALDEEKKRLNTQIVIASIRHTLDTTDEFYEKENEYLNDTLPTILPYENALNEAIASSPFRKEVEENLGKQFFTQLDLAKKQFCKDNIPLMQREAKLCDEYQKIMATCKIDFDGKTLNLYGVQKYFEAEDRAVRKAAFKKYSEFYEQNEDRLEEIWDELISIRNEMGKNLGYENFIPLGYMQQGRTDYGVKEVSAFRDQVREEIVPLCVKIYKAQAKRLGLKEIKAFDEKRVFLGGNATPIGDEDFMVEQAKKMYEEMSPETGEFIDFMITHALMDLANKPGKASTGYMESLADYKAPYVFSNFNRTKFDMEVLTHELGHAFAGYMAMRSQPISAYYSESTDIAEIHSMAMEQFTYKYAERFFGAAADKYRFAHLCDAITFVPFGVAVDEFQHICYANPSLTPKERTYKWRELELKYMPWRKYEDDEFFERGGYWYHKLHIFLYPFYYINYTLTTMGAMEFKKKMALDPVKAWSKYLTLCRIGGSKGYLESLFAASLSVPFEAGAVKKAMSYAKACVLKQMKNF